MRAASVSRPPSPRPRSPTWAAERSPSSYPTNNRSAPYELKTWQLRAYLTQYKVESDGDLHLVLNDSTGRHMVAEIPYGSCVPASSRWTSQIATARYAITHHYTVTTSWHYVHRLMDVRGLALSTSCTARPVPRATASSCTPSPASPSGRPATPVLRSSHCSFRSPMMSMPPHTASKQAAPVRLSDVS